MGNKSTAGQISLAVSDNVQKIILVGSCRAGKTALVIRFVQGVFVQEYDTTIENNYRKYLELDGMAALAECFDFSGDEIYAPVQDTYIRTAEGFLLVYSVTDKASFENCLDLYKQILRARDEDCAPVVLVGNKSDLAERVVSTAHGEELAKQNGWKFYETSAKDGTNVDEVFRDIMRQTIARKQRDVPSK
jgi:GTPase KRas protein